MYKLAFEIENMNVALITMQMGEDDKWEEVARKVLEGEALPTLLSDGDNPDKTIFGYGLLKLVQDRNSGITKKWLDENNIRDGSIEACEVRIAKYQETYDFLMGGEWRERKERKAKGPSIDAIFAEAVQVMLEKDGVKPPLSAVAAKLKTLGKEELKALRLKAEPTIQELKKEAESVDLEELF